MEKKHVRGGEGLELYVFDYHHTTNGVDNARKPSRAKLHYDARESQSPSRSRPYAFELNEHDIPRYQQ